ncbi:M23 family metallopeptidase [Pseudoalteromonas ulvae]|uniref:Peptidase n=1 Tax=Pseudoalteromonas ulvae TaxID=107327 RepID=A0A244CMB9_PSEDV|nr:M23 family metallopeptidase [Pseudoalteromonas ulvae]OUL56781.1 peptidase [Pseudoalteromonas ulvae]
MLKRGVLFASLLCCALSSNALELKGQLTQGGLVTGQLPGAKQVKFNGNELKLTQDGTFVFGFGRDSSLQHTLQWQDEAGKSHSESFLITARSYNIDKITGVAKKYVSPPESVSKRISQEARAVREARNTVSNRTDFLSPVLKPAQGRISGVYGSQRFFNGEPKRPHYGLDIANKTGTPVYAPLPGKVVFADPDLYYSGGTLILDHGHGITSTYIHLHTLDVKKGQEVNQGTKIAEIGATGRVTGPHLDWRFNWLQERLDPQLLMIDTLANKP